jgi:hypothetical protein
MENEILVYVDLQGTPNLVGRLWMRSRKDREASLDESRMRTWAPLMSWKWSHRNPI